MTPALPRSYLFVPGNRPERFDKALASGADAVIVDLEDAVPPQAKAAARAAVAAWLSPQRPVHLRINAATDPNFDDDLALCIRPGVAGLVLPKAEQAAVLAALHARLPGLALLPLVESAAGLAAVHALAAAPGVQRLVFGSLDLQLDLGLDATDEELAVFRAPLVVASRLAGIGKPVDGPAPAINDAPGLQVQAARARRLGFGAKLCIHPLQVADVNAAFAASAADAWAERVLVAAADGAAAQLDGQTIDMPLILRARALLQKR